MAGILPTVKIPAAPAITTDHTTFVVMAIMVAFLFYITSRGELAYYLELLT